jgi:adenylate cyclase
VFRVGTYALADREIRPEETAELNLAVRPLVDRYLDAFGQIYRHHSRSGVRNESVAAGAMGELRDLCVGFVDITSSSHLGERVDAQQLALLVADFERAAYGAAAAHGARVVKTIGDEVMLCADDAEPVVRSALTLVAWCGAHPTFSGARGGIARGPLLDQSGDCYGPVVNRAARFVQAALDGTVMADDAVALELLDHPDLVVDRRVPSEHRGLGIVPWSEVTTRLT